MDVNQDPRVVDPQLAQAIGLRRQGWSVGDIAVELGIAKSTAWLWVRHLPLDRESDRARSKVENARRLRDEYWSARRITRDQQRDAIQADIARSVGSLSERELLLLGAAIYWCEGTKTKPWQNGGGYLSFTNSDPVLIELFLRFLESCQVVRAGLSYRVSIHESADA